MSEHKTRNTRKLGLGSSTSSEERVDLYELEADAIKALAHPKRLLVLDLLSDGRERHVSELMEATRLSQSNLSQNLAVMRTAGLLATRREGNLVYYRVADARVVKAVTLVRAVMESQVQDRRFVVERAAAKRKEAARRAASLAVAAVLAVSALLMAYAAGHPLAAGLSPTDLPSHFTAMIASADVGGMMEACQSVAMPAPAPSAASAAA